MWIVFLVLSICVGIVSGILWTKSKPRYGYWPEEKTREARPKLKGLAIGTTIFAVVCAILLLWLTRPNWHWLWFNCFYQVPTIWLIVGVTSGLTTLLWKKERIRSLWAVIVIGFCLIIIVGPVLSRPLALCKVYDYISKDTTFINELPDTSGIRYLPMEVAEGMSRIQIGTSTRTVGDFDSLLDEEGNGVWTTPLIPSGGIRKLTRQMEGVALIESDGTLKISDASFKYGEGMVIVDSVMWKLREHRYFVEYPEIFCWFDGDTPILVAPYLTYKFQFPVRVPYWGGVCVVYPDGTIEDYTPEETRNLSFLQGQRLLPEKLAKCFVESWAYQYGIANKWWLHEDQIEIPYLDYSENQMPYLMPIGEEKRPTWVTTTEPFGEAFGLSKIFFVDSREVKMGIYETATWDRKNEKYEILETLIGPNEAWGFAKGAPGIAEYKWIETRGTTDDVTEEGTWRLLEPRPTFTGGKLYWMETVASSEYRFAQHTVLVDANAAKAKENRFVFDTEKQLRAFLAGNATTPIVPPVSPGEISPEVISQLEKLNQINQDLYREWQIFMELFLKGAE